MSGGTTPSPINSTAARTMRTTPNVSPKPGVVSTGTATIGPAPPFDWSPVPSITQVPVSGSQTVFCEPPLVPGKLDGPTVEPGPFTEPLLFPPCAPGTTGVAVCAPPVPVVHWVGPCLSQAAGCGSFLANVLVPSVEKVGLLQERTISTLVGGTTAPGMCASC